MSRNYTGSFEQLKVALASIGSDWDEFQANKKVLRRDNAVLSWFVSTGSLQFQGKTGAKERLEADTLKIIYPDQAANLTDNLTVELKEGPTETYLRSTACFIRNSISTSWHKYQRNYHRIGSTSQRSERIFLRVSDIRQSPDPDQIFMDALRYEELDYGFYY